MTEHAIEALMRDAEQSGRRKAARDLARRIRRWHDAAELVARRLDLLERFADCPSPSMRALIARDVAAALDDAGWVQGGER